MFEGDPILDPPLAGKAAARRRWTARRSTPPPHVHRYHHRRGTKLRASRRRRTSSRAGIGQGARGIRRRAGQAPGGAHGLKRSGGVGTDRAPVQRHPAARHRAATTTRSSLAARFATFSPIPSASRERPSPTRSKLSAATSPASCGATTAHRGLIHSRTAHDLRAKAQRQNGARGEVADDAVVRTFLELALVADLGDDELELV